MESNQLRQPDLFTSDPNSENPAYLAKQLITCIGNKRALLPFIEPVVLTRYKRPKTISAVSGIPSNWQRSDYNVKAKALPVLRSLLETIDAAFLLISFNNEGFIPINEMETMLNSLGSVQTFHTQYNAFRGSRSFDKRSIHVTEYLFLVERE